MAVIYQKDKNAIKCITEFYSQFTKHKLSEYEIDSILAQYDGDYEQMIKDAYAQFSKHTPTQEEIISIVNHYGLKKTRQILHQIRKVVHRIHQKRKQILI